MKQLKTRKWLACLLCLVMAVMLLPASVFAVSVDPSVGYNQEPLAGRPRYGRQRD